MYIIYYNQNLKLSVSQIAKFIRNFLKFRQFPEFSNKITAPVHNNCIFCFITKCVCLFLDADGKKLNAKTKGRSGGI